MVTIIRLIMTNRIIIFYCRFETVCSLKSKRFSKSKIVNTFITVKLSPHDYELTDHRNALIVCIGEFDHNEPRPTAPRDARRLEKTLSKLQFKCNVLCGRVVEEDILNAIDEIVQDQHRKDMFIFCVCSHGGSDDKELELSDGSKQRLGFFHKVCLQTEAAEVDVPN